MSDPITVSTLGKLAANIRQIFSRLDPVEKKTGLHDVDIGQLKQRAEHAQKELDELRKITGFQGQEIEQHKRQIFKLSQEIGHLETEVETRTGEIKSLHTVVRGEQIKRGRAKARATRAEEALSRKRK